MVHKHSIIRTKSYSLFIFLVVSALLLSSCGALSSPNSAAATPVPPSPTPLVGAATSAPIVPSSPTPLVVLDTPQVVVDTATPLPTSTPLMEQPSVATEVVPAATLAPVATTQSSTGTFTLIPGTTAGVIQGTIQPGQVLVYTLGAGQAQPLTLIMDSPNNDVTLGVLDPGGNVLLDSATKQKAWQMALPSTGMYTVQVVGGATSDTFSLTVKLPLVVFFASGATSTSLSGTTVNGYLFSYALNCAGGQTMSAALAQPASTATIDIYGLSSGTLVDASAGYNSWSGILPQTQDYIIEVVPTNSQVVNYNLTVSCTGTPGSAYYPTENPSIPSTGGQLYFLPGETMAIVQGTIQPGQVVTYSVQAKQYQALMLILGSPNGDAVLGVLDPNGNQLLDPANQYTYWQWQLPMTGLYTIKVVGGITSERFTLTTKVAPVLTYPADGKSMTIYATTVRGILKSYAFRLSAGVVMTLKLNVPANVAYLDVFGVQTGSILNASARATTWTGTMPSTQEYVVEVVPGGTMSAYTLTISNP